MTKGQWRSFIRSHREMADLWMMMMTMYKCI